MGHLWSKERFAEAGLCLNMHRGEAGVVTLKKWAGGPKSTGIHVDLRGTERL